MTKRAGNLCTAWLLAALYVFVMLWLWLAPARAQQTQLGLLGQLSPSSGAGYGTGYGVAGHGAAALLDERLAVVGTLSSEQAPKLYIGDGSVTRGRIEARYFLRALNGFQPFASAGLNYSRTDTSQYSKSAYHALLGGGARYRNEHFDSIYRYHFLPREQQTANELSGHRFGADFYVPLTRGSRWHWLMQLEYQTWRYYQPTGPDKGEHRAQAFGLGIGVGRRFGQ